LFGTAGVESVGFGVVPSAGATGSTPELVFGLTSGPEVGAGCMVAAGLVFVLTSGPEVGAGCMIAAGLGFGLVAELGFVRASDSPSEPSSETVAEGGCELIDMSVSMSIISSRTPSRCHHSAGSSSSHAFIRSLSE